MAGHKIRVAREEYGGAIEYLLRAEMGSKLSGGIERQRALSACIVRVVLEHRVFLCYDGRDVRGTQTNPSGLDEVSSVILQMHQLRRKKKTLR
jgi:hypothetical protein